MPPRGLLDLPVELLLTIIEFAVYSGDQPIANEDQSITDEDQSVDSDDQSIAYGNKKLFRIRDLVLVNRLFSRLALPLLYKSLHDAFVSDYNPLGFDKLVITLLFDPTRTRYGGFVRSFKVINQEQSGLLPSLISDLHREVEYEWIGLTKEKGDELVKLIDVVLKYEERAEMKERWRRDFVDKPLLAAYLVLMLMRLPNLEDLEILDVNPDFWEVIDYIGDGLLAASKHADSGISQPFAKLEHITLGSEESNLTVIPSILTMTTKWPSIKSVLGARTVDPDMDDIDAENDHGIQIDPDPWFLDLQPRSTNFTDISLVPDSKLLSEHLIRFLGTAKALERFEYQIGHSISYIPISTPLLHQALTPHVSTLKTLLLYLDTCELGRTGSNFTPMSFASFSALETLHIAHYLLFGFNEHNPLFSIFDRYRPLKDEDLAAQFREVEAHVVRALPRSLRDFGIHMPETFDAFKVACHAGKAVLMYRDPEVGSGDVFDKLQVVKINPKKEGVTDEGRWVTAEIYRIAGQRDVKVVKREKYYDYDDYDDDDDESNDDEGGDDEGNSNDYDSDIYDSDDYDSDDWVTDEDDI